jgi:KDO2-lipid IV(A) lauroyltransferase
MTDRTPFFVSLRRRVTKPLARVLMAALTWVASWSSHEVAMRRAGRWGRAFYVLCGWWRRVALAQLAMAFPGWSRREVKDCARHVFVNFTKTLFEFLRSPRVGDAEFARLARLHGAEVMHDALARGKGVVLLAAHYDNWEWIGRRLALEGFPVSVIARSHYDPRMTSRIDQTRETHGLRVVDRDDIRSALRALRAGEVVAILPDQNTAVGGIFVPFFGRPAATAVGPARLALRTNAAVVWSLSRRAADDSHDVFLCRAEVPQPTGDDERDSEAFMAAATRELEEWIREVPDQWLWIHKRWKRQPEPEEARPET